MSGFIIGTDGSPVDGASVVVYKQMGLINSAVKNAGYSSSCSNQIRRFLHIRRSTIRCVQIRSDLIPITPFRHWITMQYGRVRVFSRP